ncbi:MAG: topoisomerase protein [candidate division WS6 bacterium GW2011_GWF2_39_15]|uniref:DNA topoisomerase 1 n=1 Tax=candidate division WS6 bacterium GW2011_GWF2_39_15 TaxID=1619100 RepID=A0A0G0Q7E9_9BACT|nr:MAG: topoisomerase protein [candidate division WS6 bacterium GW2011_GWF2_39_15]
MNLVLVESPAKAKTIEKYLGKDFKVFATLGHVIDLPKNKLAVDVDKGYEPEFVTIKGKAALIRKLKKEVPKDGDVYLAMDPDREGEAIAYHAAQSLKIKNPKRITFHEITKNAVLEAVKSPREVDMDLVTAQFARRVLDRLVGYKVSGLLWKKIRYGLSAGRVQSVALRLIAQREEEIKNFVAQEYWEVYADLETSDGKVVRFKLVKIESKRFKADNSSIIEEILQDIKNNSFNIVDVKKGKRAVNAPPPFTTSTLQQAGNNHLGYSAKRTMGLAQSLYQQGYITYMRTDSQNMSKEAIEAFRGYIGGVLGKEYVPATPNFFRKKSKLAQEAHEAIRPTDVTKSGSQLKGLDPQEKKLYDMIRNRAIASQMSQALYDTFNIDAQPENTKQTYTFNVSAQNCTFEGFKKLWNVKFGKDDEDVQEISKIEKGDKLENKEIVPIQKFTTPKSRYTEATLVKQLELLGVGRPSTYATIISTIMDRGYVVKVEKKLAPTDIGMLVNSFLVNHFNRMVDYKYTAKVEDGLDGIAEGKVKYEPFIDKEYKPLMADIERIDKEVKKEDVVTFEKSDEKCPECGSEMVVKLGRYGKFLSCSKFPNCKGMKSLENDDFVLDENKYVKETKCEKCGKDMIMKNGKFGRYWACSDYPKCKTTKPLMLLEKCPDCGSNLVERKGKWGRSFTGCSAYPKCKYIKKAPKKGS